MGKEKKREKKTAKEGKGGQEEGKGGGGRNARAAGRKKSDREGWGVVVGFPTPGWSIAHHPSYRTDRKKGSKRGVKRSWGGSQETGEGESGDRKDGTEKKRQKTIATFERNRGIHCVEEKKKTLDRPQKGKWTKGYIFLVGKKGVNRRE